MRMAWIFRRIQLTFTVAAVTLCIAGDVLSFDQPVLKWSWSDAEPGDPYPAHVFAMMSPSIIDLTNDGKPEVVFATTDSTSGLSIQVGLVRVLRGTDGSQLFTITDPSYRVNATSAIATGDIDSDGWPEIIACDSTGNRLIAFEHDGTFKWRSGSIETINSGAPAIADLNNDGAPEIVIGRQVLDNNGSLLWTGTGGSGQQGSGPLSLVSDVDADGFPEIVAGNTVYRGDGTIKWQNTSLPDGYNAIGNFDEDDTAEIVLVSGGQVWLLEHNLAVKWGPMAIPEGGSGGPPVVADFDGDGSPEIGVAGAYRYAVFETNGSLKWAVTIQDPSSSRTGSSAFDFDGDGAAEAVYRDETKLRISRGDDGTVLFETPLSSCTWHEYPIVADIDGDGEAELLSAANPNCGVGLQRGIYAYENPFGQWMKTRKIWNQYTYHITNVNLDGSIPMHEEKNWLVPGLNNFRMNQFGQFEGPPCKGSLGPDGDVDGSDLAGLVHDFGVTDCSQGCPGDLNGDSKVNEDDLLLFAEDFGKVNCK